MATTVASAQVQLSPSVTGFAQKLRDELRTVETGLGDFQVNIVPQIKASSYRAVETNLERLARDRTVKFTATADTRVAANDFANLTRARRSRVVADVDTRVAADDLAALTRPRDVTVRANADTRVAADDLALLTRDRTVTINTHVNGSPATSGVAAAAGNDSGALGALISLVPALVPVAAYLGSVTVEATSAAVAVGVFGAAVLPQAKQLSGLATALDTLSAAQDSNGASSEKAVEAQNKARATLDGVPEATKRAAAGYGMLRDSFTQWSDGLADFTMDPVNKGFAVTEAILPKLNPLVIDTSTQFSRLITLVGGGVNSGAFDGLMSRFTTFTNGVLTKGVDEAVHFARVLSEGKADGPISEFMQYAKQNGPLVRDTLENIAKAVTAVLKGASQAGPGMLSMVNSVVKLVAALPPSFIGRALQLYTIFRLYKLASSGVTALGGSLTRLSTSFTALRATSTAAGGGVAGAGAAIGTLSTGAKVAGALVVVAGLTLALKHFVDQAGAAKVSASSFESQIKGLAAGDNAHKTLDQIATDLKNISKNPGGGLVKDNSVLGLIFGGSKKSSADKDLKNFGSALADLVKNGDADEAAAALQKLNVAGEKIPTKYLKDYKSALADAKFESDLAAQAQGLFGKQAQDVQKKLDSQKQSADGLRGAIQALNDTYRASLDADSDFEQAIDDATKAVKGHTNALHMVNGQLDLSSQKARDAYKPLGDLASKTDAAAAAARDNGESWSTVNGIYAKGRTALIHTAEQMGLTTAAAKTLANQILKTPDKTAQIKGNVQDLQAKINTAKAQIKSLPSSKTAAIKGDESQLKDVIRDAQARINALQGKSIIIRATTVYDSKGNPSQVYHEGGNYASGGVLPGYTPGKDVHHFYSPTAGRLNLSGGEAVMRPEWTRAVGPAFINAMNALSRTRGIAGVRAAMGFKDGGILGAKSSFASGGIVGTRTQNVVLVSGKKINESSIASAISSAFLSNLNGTVDQIKSAVSNVVSAIKTAFKGAKTTVDDNLINALNKQSTQLQNLAKKRDSIKSTIATATTYATDATNSATSFAGLTGLPSAGNTFDAAGVLSGLNTRLGQVKKFASNLALLAKRGLDKSLLDQLVQAGPDSGGAYAQALADASDSELKSINSTESSISKAATSYGQNVADSMYDTGAQAGQGFLSGLKAQESSIEKEMTTLAKKVQSAVKKALKIKSPSRVMAEVGEYVGQGLVVGMESTHPEVAASAQKMADLVSSVDPTSIRIEPATPGAGQGQTVNHFELHTTDTPTEEGVLAALQKLAVLRRPALI